MKIFKILITFSILLGMASCRKWLQVQPEDKFTEEQMYSSAASIADVMNGLYLQLSDNNLYGRNLTLDKLDLFAQRYYAATSGYAYYYYSTWAYTNTSVQTTILNIWSSMYTTIGNDNLFIQNLGIYGSRHLDQTTLNEYYGAAYGLRAFMHFDLLRLFGPIYGEDTKGDSSIPYYKKFDGNIKAFLPVDSVIANIKMDIDSAEYYLAQDPILTQKGTDNLNNYRFNLYAVKALKARMYLWVGDKTSALNAAKEVIAAQSQFPWVTLANLTNTDNPDKKFFTETIFNVYQDDLYDLYDDIFSPDLRYTAILSTGGDNQVDNIFETNQADYRYVYSWPYPTAGSVSFRTFVKYKDIPNADEDDFNSRFGIPLIRISEMYYIAAECETDESLALEYLNTVRRNRGLAVDISDYSALKTELTKEYQKEFYGEGQLWYYYKRTQTTSVPSPNTATSLATIALSRYVLPIPDEENVGR